MKKKLKYIEKKLIKLLNKKVSVISIIWIILLNIISIILFKSYINNPKYKYRDMNNSIGTSTSCYYNEESRDLRCLIPVKVNQYYKI